MRRIMRSISALAGVALLAGTLSACDEKEDQVAQSPPAQSQEESPAPEPAEEEAAPEETEAPPAEPEEEEQTDPAEPVVEGEDPATMEDDNPNVDYDAVVVDYETLPGDCHNDVPLPDSKHGVVSTTQDEQGECVIVIDSRGDSLFMAQDIGAQLSALGFFQTSVSPPDSSEDALNVVSYLTNTHEVYVTVQQDGVSGVMITYALIDKLRGNG